MTEAKQKEIKFVANMPKDVTINYGGQKVTVTPFLTMAAQLHLITNYVARYFGDKKEDDLFPYNYMNAECDMMNRLYQICTDINTETMDFEIYADSRLWGEVTKEIVNYQSFLERRDAIVNDIKSGIMLESSTGAVLARLESAVMGFINNIGDIDPSVISDTTNAVKDVLLKIEESSVLKTVTDDMSRATPAKKKTKKAS